MRRESYWTFFKHNWPCFIIWYRNTSWNVLAEGSIITVSACENVEFLQVQLYVPWALFSPYMILQVLPKLFFKAASLLGHSHLSLKGLTSSSQHLHIHFR